MSNEFENLAIFPGSELELIRSFMAGEGVPEHKWLFGSGLSLMDLGSSSRTISLKQFDVIYRNVYRLGSRPGLGIDFGLALNLSRWGMLSSALLCANTLGHALSIADKFREILRSRFDMVNRIRDDAIVVDLLPKPGMAFPVNDVFAYEVLLGTLKTQITQLIGEPFRFQALKLPYAKPIGDRFYQKVSEAKVHFGADIGQLTIPMKVMQQPLPMANRVTRSIVVAHCSDELERVRNARAGDIVFTVRSLLAQAADKLPGLESVASELSMSPRTLRRRLSQEGVQFRQLCEQQRQQLAIDLLSSRHYQLSEIAHRCGFVDSVSFHKAFKRWTGETPNQYRQNLS